MVSATAIGQTTWKTFSHKNGFTILLPDYFNTGLLIAGGTLQYYSTELDDQIYVSIETGGKPEELQASFERDLQSDEITYKVIKPTWYVISGKQEGDIFYNKTITKNGVLQYLRIRYPVKDKTIMDDIIPKIAASFK